MIEDTSSASKIMPKFRVSNRLQLGYKETLVNMNQG